MTEPCMFPNLHELFYCRIHADVRLRLTDERCRRGVTLTASEPQPDAVLREAALDSYRDGWAAGYKEGCEQTEKAATPAAPKEDDRAE